MKDYALILYGGFALTGNANIFTYKTDDLLSVMSIQTLKNARSAGRAVVNADVDSKDISLDMTIVSDASRDAVDVYNEMMQEFENMGRFLRVTPSNNWDFITNLSADDNYQLSGDATNRTFTQTQRIFQAGVKFDIQVGLTGSDFAKLTNTELLGLDLSEFEDSGNFEFSLYIPNTTYITSVQLTVGSDISNYGVATLTKQHDGSAIMDGWNYFSIPWSSLAFTGEIDPNLVGRYVDIQINYTADQESTECVFGGLLWQNDDRSVNYEVFFNGMDIDTPDRRGSRIGGKVKFLCPEGIGQSTSERIANALSNQSSASNSIVSTFGGTYQPRPIIRLTFSTVTNLSSIVVNNLTTGDSVTVTPTSWGVGDILEFNLMTKQVLLNNRPIAYTSVLPRFRLGRNRLNITMTSTSQATISQVTNNTNLKGQG